MEYLCRIPSPVGLLTATSDGQSIRGLWLEGQTGYAAGMQEQAEEKDLPVFERLRQWLAVYFDGRQPDFDVPLCLQGSDFRQAVWRLLLEIPYGSVTTYGTIARRLSEESGRPASARAVGGAVGHNPVSILVPCHRVIGASGKLTGYAGGLDAKIRLLRLERALD